MIRRLIAALFLTTWLSVSAADKPNIVFLLADDMNRDTWGVYGSKDCKTPNIDLLSKDGLTFTKAYCSVAMCAPFRQELYSGRSPWRTGTLANHSKSNTDTRSIPHYLQPLGYRVALTGKTHIGPASAYPFEILKGGQGNKSFVENTKNFLDACQKDNSPFCLFIASKDGHAPFTSGDPSQYDKDALTIPPYWLDTPMMRETLVKYYAEVTNFDQLVGEVRAVLEDKGLWENTLFVVCSEQGIQLPFAKWTCYNNGLNTGIVMSWPGVIDAGSVCDELISIADVTPTLVDAAGGTLKPSEVDGKSFLRMLKGEPHTLHDYVYGAFTNCNIIDNRNRIYPIRVIRNKEFSLIYNPNFKGYTSNVTLSPVMAQLYPEEMSVKSKSAHATREAATWIDLQGSSEHADALIQKLNKRPEYELYRLSSDPHEMKNEINNPEYEGIAAEMKKALMAQLSALGDSDPMSTEASLVRGKAQKKESKKRKDNEG